MKIKLPTVLTLLVVISGVGMLYLAYQVTLPFTPNPPLVVKNNPAPVRPDTINPEAVVIISPIICKKVQAQAHVSRVLVSNSTQILLNDYTNNLPKGCSSRELTAIIPSNTPDGRYHIEYTVVYQLNSFKTSTAYWRTQEFTVKHEPPLPVVSQTQVIPSKSVPGQTPTTSTVNTTTNTTTNTTQVTKPESTQQKPTLIQRVLNVVGL